MTLSYGTPSLELETSRGPLQIVAHDGCLLIYRKPWESIPFLRIHSACMFGESLGGLDCDCRAQLDAALDYVAKNGGAVAYLAQEGRGIGLTGKVAAMSLQQSEGIDTATAYKKLGQFPDPRDYRMLAPLLEKIEFPKTVKLDTNNPLKVEALVKMGFLVDRIKLTFDVTQTVAAYLDQKKIHLGHYG